MPKIWMNLWSTIASFFWYNAELQIIIIIIIMAKKKLIMCKTSLGIGQPVKMFILGSLESSSP